MHTMEVNCELGGRILDVCPNLKYLAGKDGGVKSDGFYATGCYRMLRNFDLVASYDYFNANTISMQTKPSVGNRPII